MPQENTPRKIMFSGIQPSGELHIGNYLGAIQNWVKYMDTYDCIYSIVDYHALTVPYDTQLMPTRIQELAMMLLACGLTPERCTLFRQSDVLEHTALSWILSCVTTVNYLERMIQFKEKSEQHGSPNIGLFSYPILQSADILLYKAQAVPVGEDQLQHLELSRDVARKFNLRVEQNYFPEPEPVLSPARRILGLDGDSKMSKSKNNTIALADSKETIAQKMQRAKTDERRQRLSDPGEPEDCNVFTLHKYFSTEADREQIAPKCRSAEIGCRDCKGILVDRMDAHLAPIRESYAQWKEKPAEVEEILQAGAARARGIAQQTLSEVHELLGLPHHRLR